MLRCVGVALLTESVDRNAEILRPFTAHTVALLTESVDRNIYIPKAMQAAGVALLTESVDRNSGRYWRVKARGRRSPHGERG